MTMEKKAPRRIANMFKGNRSLQKGIVKLVVWGVIFFCTMLGTNLCIQQKNLAGAGLLLALSVVAVLIILGYAIVDVFKPLLHKKVSLKMYHVILFFIILIPAVMFAVITWFMEKSGGSIDIKDRGLDIALALLGYIGTVSLGLLAFWQNNKLNKINEQLQERVQKREELEKRPILYIYRKAPTGNNFLLGNVAEPALNIVVQAFVDGDAVKGVSPREIGLLIKGGVANEEEVEVRGEPLQDIQFKDIQLKIYYNSVLNQKFEMVVDYPNGSKEKKCGTVTRV